MSQVNGCIRGINGTLTIHTGGKVYNVDSGHTNYNKILDDVRAGTYVNIPTLANAKQAITEYIKKADVAGTTGLKIEGSCVSYNGRELKGVLIEKILEFSRNNWNAKPLINFLTNLMQNPSKRSVDSLYSFLEKWGMVITDDGYFLGYKSVNDNYTDCHTGKISNKVGEVVKEDRNSISDDPNSDCSFGLHVGSLDFVRTFSGPRKLVVKVNPRDVVSVPNADDCQKMRVCEYEVIQEITEDYKAVQQSSYSDSWDTYPSTATKEDYDVDENEDTCGECGEEYCDGECTLDDEDEDEDDDYTGYFRAYGQ